MTETLNFGKSVNIFQQNALDFRTDRGKESYHQPGNLGICNGCTHNEPGNICTSEIIEPISYMANALRNSGKKLISSQKITINEEACLLQPTRETVIYPPKQTGQAGDFQEAS